MWGWLHDNSTTLQVLVSLLSTCVWITYLHVFLSSYRRQTRSSLMISREGARDLKARCIVSNMGSEAAFLMDVLVEFETEGKKFTTSVIDRLELQGAEGDTSKTGSAQGPMASGSYVDIGSFEDILTRAHRQFDSADFTRDILRTRLIAIAATSQARDLVAACRGFEFIFGTEGSVVHVRPIEIAAKQIRSRRKRKSLRRLLEKIQRDEVLNRSVSPELIGRPGAEN
ncbi:hypothetical protein EDD52_10894 [Primorskyibacter sedentarius]|uniref:Uncharacterized protein n=1 Tax=Primorskyibacter sedentarius TaxID=745311 RepID=A0A4R3JA18_9RHOB|nr:hypothetical protein [Primorskyibacter sedentarius]TCS62799.1 hypothetical protein EDD52_10894 [Primorskyibacter sedentarius]